MSRSFEGRTIGLDDDIFEAGFGNSLFAMQLVTFVEQAFGIEIDSEDLDIDNFRTIRRVAALIERKRAAPAWP
jgi:acyl carrier protein